MNTAFKAALISAALAAVAAPAFAQDYGHRGHDNRGPSHQQNFAREGFDLFRDIERMENRIERARDTRAISRQEARRASSELRDIRNDLNRATAGRRHLTSAAHHRFEQRIDRVGGYLRMARDDRGRPYRG